MAFSIFGKVQVDPSSVTRSFAAIRAAAAPAGKEIGGQLRGAILSAFGAGAGVALFRRTLQRAFDIRKGAGQLGIDTQTFQTLQMLSNQTGASLESLADKFVESAEKGTGFAETIRAANAELEHTGQIIEAGTVDKLADTFDKLAQLTGRLAPGIAHIIDKLIAGYDASTKWVQYVFGKFGQFFYKLAGNEDEAEIRRIMAEDAFAEPEAETKPATAVDTARTIASEIAKADAAERRKEKDSTTQRGTSRMDVSGDTAIGRYIGGRPVGSSPVEGKLDMLNGYVRDIRARIDSYK